jgi:hypothetical protein
MRIFTTGLTWVRDTFTVSFDLRACSLSSGNLNGSLGCQKLSLNPQQPENIVELAEALTSCEQIKTLSSDVSWYGGRISKTTFLLSFAPFSFLLIAQFI